MKLAHLKKIRVLVSLIFFILTTLVFLDFRNIFPGNLINGIVYMQFVPSLIKFLNLLSFAGFGFIITLIITILFGRVYCSTICPLGILQDVISYFSRKFKKKKKSDFHFTKAKNLLRYSILVLTIIFLLGGSVILVSLLDPYSVFGRITSYIFKPGLVEVNNVIANVLNSFNLYFLYPVELKEISFVLMMFPIFMLGLILWMAIFHGRLYCNTVCPAGTLLGIISEFSIFKISIDSNACTSCSLCEKVCKSGCINYIDSKVDLSRCVACYNCLKICPASAMKYNISFKKEKKLSKTIINTLNYNRNKKIEKSGTDLNKRIFVFGFFAYLFGLVGISFGQDKITPTKDSTIPEDKEFPVSPPGSISIDNFVDTCTACSLCIGVCPNQVLQPSFLQYGLAGIMQPYMDYHTGFCNYECKKCTEICPTGAILKMELDIKKLSQLGKAKFVQKNCIVEVEKTDCGACSEHCPTKAVHMIPYERNLLIPEVTEDICIGCGACEYACPTTPYKAIYIDGNPIHLEANLPEIEELESTDEEEDFPF